MREAAGAASEACIERTAAAGLDRGRLSAEYVGSGGANRHVYLVSDGSRPYRCVVDDAGRVTAWGPTET